MLLPTADGGLRLVAGVFGWAPDDDRRVAVGSRLRLVVGSRLREGSR